MKPAKQHAIEAWAYVTLGNIAVPANHEAAVKALTPFFEAAIREALEEAAMEPQKLAPLRKMWNGGDLLDIADKIRKLV